MTSIDFTSRHFLVSTIRKYFPDAKIFFFGSRMRGDYKPFSDIDLCVDAGSSMNLGQLALLEEEFSESDLQYKVDLSDWHRISEEFRKHILGASEAW